MKLRCPYCAGHGWYCYWHGWLRNCRQQGVACLDLTSCSACLGGGWEP